MRKICFNPSTHFENHLAKISRIILNGIITAQSQKRNTNIGKIFFKIVRLITFIRYNYRIYRQNSGEIFKTFSVVYIRRCYFKKLKYAFRGCNCVYFIAKKCFLFWSIVAVSCAFITKWFAKTSSAKFTNFRETVHYQNVIWLLFIYQHKNCHYKIFKWLLSYAIIFLKLQHFLFLLRLFITG